MFFFDYSACSGSDCCSIWQILSRLCGFSC